MTIFLCSLIIPFTKDENICYSSLQMPKITASSFFSPADTNLNIFNFGQLVREKKSTENAFESM